MNIIDIVGNNYFLKKIFPNGLEKPVLLGRLELTAFDRITLYIYTQ